MEDKKNRVIGSDIQDIVKDAVSTMDFKKLNNEITTSVNNALADVRSALGIQAEGDRLRGTQPKPGTWRPAEPQDINRADRMPGQAQQGMPMNQRRPHMQPVQQRQQGQPQRQPVQQNPAGRQGYEGRAGQQGQPVRQGSSGWRNWEQQRNQAPTAQVSQADQPGRQLYKGVRIPFIPRGKVLGGLATGFGGFALTGFSISMIVFIILLFATGQPVFWHLIIGFTIPLITSYIVTKAGSNLRARNRRLNIYLKQLQYRGFCSIKELSGAIGESERFVLRDIRKMLSLGMFPDGHLDQNGTCFIAARECFEQYADAHRGYEQRLIEDNRRLLEEQERLLRQNNDLKNRYERQLPVKEDPYSNLTQEVRDAIISGRGQIKLIKEANDAIPGEEISAKLDRLELVIDRILYHIEKHPEKLHEIRRFMDYYLPTTLKLVNAYRDFDSQPLQGENILTAKEEIMKTLDTINSAFEKLLDSMFEDAAMDVSTDISVLETMLAQEGLTESDFTVDQA